MRGREDSKEADDDDDDVEAEEEEEDEDECVDDVDVGAAIF